MNCQMNLIVIFLTVLQFLSVKGENLVISGDTKVLTNTTAHFKYTLQETFTIPVFFQYEIHLELPTGSIDQLVYSRQVAEWKHDFKNIPPGSYQMNVKVYLFVFGMKEWKVAEKTITIEVRDGIEDFFTIFGHQEGFSDHGPSNVFVTNKTINFTGEYDSDNSALKRADLTYVWSIEGPNNFSLLHSKQEIFSQNLTVVGFYKIILQVTANFSEYGFVKNGTITKQINIKAPVKTVNFDGNNFVENGSLFRLNVTWDGSSAFIFCHYFSVNKTEKSCFDSGVVLDVATFSFSRYLDVNGTMYVNVGIQNDVSQIMKTFKITIYKVGPKQSMVFIILPLVSLLAVIAFIGFGIAHHIKRRANLNSTIETATIENFGLNRSNETMQEISFFKRIRLTIQDIFHYRRLEDNEES